MFKLLMRNKSNDINVVSQLVDESKVNLMEALGAPSDPRQFLEEHKLQYLTPTADVEDEVRSALDNDNVGINAILTIVEREDQKGLKISQSLATFILESLFATLFDREDLDATDFIGST